MIVFSLVILVALLSSAVFFILKFNPALAVRLILKRNTSSWQVSFDDITCVDTIGYTVKALTLSYDGKELLSADKAEIDLTPGEVISFVREKGGEVEIRADECTFDLTALVEAYKDTDGSSPDNGFSLYEFVMDRNFTASVGTVHVSSESLWGDISNIEAVYSSEENTLRTHFSLESTHFNYPSYQGTVKDGEITLIIDDDIWIEGEMEGVDLYTSGIREVLSSVTLSGSTDSVSDFFSADFCGNTEVKNGTIIYDDFRLELGTGMYSYEEKSLSGCLDSITAYYDSIVLDLTLPVFCLSYTGDYEVSAVSSGIKVNDLEFDMDEPSFSGSLMDLSLAFTSPLITTGLSETTNGIFGRTEITDVKMNVTADETALITGTFDTSIETGNEKFDDITFSSELTYFLSREESGSFALNIFNLTPGFETASPLSLSINGNKENAVIESVSEKLKLRSTLSLLRGTLKGSIELDSLTLKNVLELILDRQLKYLTENTLVSLSAGYDLGWGNEERKLLGTADWKCSFDYSWKKLFSVLLSSSSSLVFNGDTVDVNDLLITSPLFTLEGDGYYDIVTGTPHIEFK